MKIASLDFETANVFQGSVCSVGVALFEDGKLIRTMDQRIMPHSDCRYFCKEIGNRFASSYKNFGALPEGISQYWLENKVLSSSDISQEPTEDTINWILDADDFLSAEKDKTYCFSKTDWEEIRELVNAEACDLDINLLSDLMSIIVENGAL